MSLRTRGFTLLELLLVVVLLGVAAALAAPSLHRWVATARARGALDRVVSGLYLARMTAVREGRRAELVLESGADGCVFAYRVRVQGSSAVVQRRELAAGAAGVCVRHSGSAALAFDSRGMLLPPTRRVYVSGAAVPDTVLVSIAGRVRRSY